MKKILRIFAAGTIFFVLSFPAMAEMYLFVDGDCHFCNELTQELDRLNYYSEFDIAEYDVLSSEENANLYLEKIKEVGYGGDQIPLLIDGDYFTGGKDGILEYLGAKQTENSTEGDGLPLLTEEESSSLNEIIEYEIKNQQNPPNGIKEGLQHLPKSEKTEKIIGIIAILFGLTLFGTIVRRARKKRPKNR